MKRIAIRALQLIAAFIIAGAVSGELRESTGCAADPHSAAPQEVAPAT